MEYLGKLDMDLLGFKIHDLVRLAMIFEFRAYRVEKVIYILYSTCVIDDQVSTCLAL
jgi:hypothetical protein